jgi:nucleoside-diphosphate-sugar epimerase
MERRTQSVHPLTGSTVLVTGGTGFTGTNLVRKLTDLEVEVRGIARETSQIDPDLEKTVTWYRGDVYDPKVVRSAMDGVNYVFHLAACFRDAGATDEEYRKVHVDSTQLLAEAALEQSGFHRFIHTSTIGVHGHVAEPPADETAPYNPGDIYQDTKLEGELWVRDFAEQHSLPMVVIRPAQIMGPTDRRLVKLFKFAKYGACPLLDGHNTKLHFIHVEDLTDCMLLCAYHPHALGEVFICGNVESTSLVDTVTEVENMLNTTVWFIHLPSKPLFMLADLIEWVSQKLNVEPILFRRRMAFFTKDRSFDTSKLQEVLDFDHRYDNKTAILDTARGYREKGWM